MSNLTLQKIADAMKLINESPSPFANKVFVDDTVCVQRQKVQFKFPRRKCHRLRKKFAKNPKNWRIETKEFCYKTPFGYIVSRRCMAALLAAEKG